MVNILSYYNRLSTILFDSKLQKYSQSEYDQTTGVQYSDLIDSNASSN